MTKKRPTYKDLLLQRGKEQFVGRDEEREAFRRNFGREVPEHLIFAVHGQAGIGKSFLEIYTIDLAYERSQFLQIISLPTWPLSCV